MIKSVVNPAYKELASFIENLPNTFLSTGEVVYSGRNIIKTFDVKGFKLNVKSFKKPLWINQVAYSTFRLSKAHRSYIYAQKLIEKGFHTPMPIAYMEYRKFYLLKHSLYISIHETFDGMLRELQQGKIEGREELLKQFALFTAKLHNQNILHLDYSSGNILYKKEGSKYTFYLVDLNRMIFDKPVSMNAGCYSFRRLWGSDEMISFIVKEYALARGFDMDTCLKKTFEYRTKFWNNYRKQYPDAHPYWD